MWNSKTYISKQFTITNEGMKSWSHLEINQYVVHHINKFKEKNSCHNPNNYKVLGKNLEDVLKKVLCTRSKRKFPSSGSTFLKILLRSYTYIIPTIRNKPSSLRL